MGDLRSNAARLRELAAFILSREGFVPFLYCDKNGFVTIGIGTLVATEQDARQMAQDPSVRFTSDAAPRRYPTVDDVVAEWRLVRGQPRLRQADYARKTKFRLDTASVNYLLTKELSRSANALYRLHPFLIGFDSRVAMAFIDTRYNPAGINPYASPQTKPLWDALNPAGKRFDLITAVTLFEKLWAGRGGNLAARYAGRHWQRTQWLRQGLQAMGAPGGLKTVSD